MLFMYVCIVLWRHSDLTLPSEKIYWFRVVAPQTTERPQKCARLVWTTSWGGKSIWKWINIAWGRGYKGVSAFVTFLYLYKEYKHVRFDWMVRAKKSGFDLGMILRFALEGAKFFKITFHHHRFIADTVLLKLVCTWKKICAIWFVFIREGEGWKMSASLGINIRPRPLFYPRFLFSRLPTSRRGN